MGIILALSVTLIPIAGLIWIGIRRENERKELMLKEAIKALRIVGVSRGRHLK